MRGDLWSEGVKEGQDNSFTQVYSSVISTVSRLKSFIHFHPWIIRFFFTLHLLVNKVYQHCKTIDLQPFTHELKLQCNLRKNGNRKFIH